VIEQAIRLRDKVLLVLSEASIASTWVEGEVEKAFEEERQRGRLGAVSGAPWTTTPINGRSSGCCVTCGWRQPTQVTPQFGRSLI
jgi:hypothetical protein